MTSSRPDLTALLEHYGAQRVPVRHGWASMRCPFHEDKTSSASVNVDDEAFKCFTCGVQGDAYSIIMKQEGIGYRAAVEWAKQLPSSERVAGRHVPRTSPYSRPTAGSDGERRPYRPPGRRG